MAQATAAEYGTAAVLIMIFCGIQLYRSRTSSTLDPSLAGSARKMDYWLTNHEPEKDKSRKISQV